MSQPQSMQQGFVGFVVEVSSYTEAKAIVYTESATLLRYGALALVEEPGTGKRYLALVADVSEHSMMPSIDQARLSEVTRLATRSKLRNARKLLELLFSPTQSLIRWHGIRELKLRILGEISQVGLVLPSRPPRPSALVIEPSSKLLQPILLRGVSTQKGLYLGELAYNPGVSVYLDPDKLTMHLAVVGQTGSGKTETVKRLVAEYSWRKSLFSTSGGVLVFDIAGEYLGYPYLAPGASPLLDAVMNPGLFTSLKGEWARAARKTILVPYDLASIGFSRGDEERYVREYLDLVEHLDRRYSCLGYRPLAVVYARHGVYLVEPGQKGPRPITREEAAHLIINEPLLVVGMPLPSVLSVEEIDELSKSTSTAYRDNIETLADMLRILELGLIHEVKGFSTLIHLARTNGGGAATRLRGAFNNAVNVFQKTYEEKRDLAAAESKACRELVSRLGAGFIDCYAVASLYAYLYAAAASELLDQGRVKSPGILDGLQRIASYYPRTRLAQPDPGISPWLVAAEAHILDPQLSANGIKQGLQSRVSHWISQALDFFNRQAASTQASIARGLRRVERHVSARLDAVHYRLIVERALEGFTIALLSRPSRGDTDHAVARLIDEAFHVSVARYEPARRTLVVIEEAHNLAPAGREKASKHMLLRVAREGRKWGLSLVLVSQRPGFIDPDILSQAATLIALRITNPDDIAGLRRGSESASQELVERLPDLDQGQAVVAGIAVPERRIPLLVRVTRLEPRAGAQAPCSGEEGEEGGDIG